ncbi:hypothetical protein GH742_01690 [Legionella sp. MW5194]|uniref:hypothetical protein n=1 Tax=Legionella sp. MW5194 TaxID=2662448 RepID=UPI00193CB06B|nr:hypothetical protein [Legionella sp. MW5194]QRN02686.1 hypothetical protein GH742_01690 [Legionella sp. MW5194]
MGAFNILIYGKSTEAKTQFVGRLTQNNLEKTEKHPFLIPGRIENSPHDYHFWVIDTSYQSLLSLYCRDTPIVLYFIENWDVTQMAGDIEALRKANSSLPILIVNAAEKKNEIAVASFADCPVLPVADMHDTNRDNVFHAINQMIKAKKDCEQEAYFLFKAEITAMGRAKQYALKGSALYDALEQLERELENAPLDTREAIAQSAERLMKARQQIENMGSKDAIISTFLQECQSHVYGEHYRLAQAIVTVAIIATLTLVAAVIGFAAGFSLGLWSGPGAFFSGIAAGVTAANAVLGISGVVGGVAGSLISYGVFRSNPVMKAANHVAQSMTPAPTYMDTDL